MSVVDRDLVTPDPAGQAADWYKDAVIYQIHVKAFQDSKRRRVRNIRPA